MRFTPSQIQVLERRFQKQHYLLPADRKFLAKSLQMTERQVKTWFQNKRAQYKRTRPLVRNPVYHHPGPPGSSTPLALTTTATTFPRLQIVQTGHLGLNIHLPVAPTAALGCHLLPPPPQLQFAAAVNPAPLPPLPPHFPMPMAYIPIPITPAE